MIDVFTAVGGRASQEILDVLEVRFRTVMSQVRTGLAKVCDKASHYRAAFSGWVGENVIDVSELELGTFVLVLPLLCSDLGWAPVVVNEYQRHEDRENADRYYACFTWIHPQCLEFISINHTHVITIGHTLDRNRYPSSHDIGKESPGTRRHHNSLVLDARWPGHQGIWGCKGYCYNVVVELMRDRERMADILDFASEQEGGIVACERGTHRSVSAGKVLELFFHRKVDYNFASRDNCECGQPAKNYMSRLSNAAHNWHHPKICLC